MELRVPAGALWEWLGHHWQEKLGFSHFLCHQRLRSGHPHHGAQPPSCCGFASPEAAWALFWGVKQPLQTRGVMLPGEKPGAWLRGMDLSCSPGCNVPSETHRQCWEKGSLGRRAAAMKGIMKCVGL